MHISELNKAEETILNHLVTYFYTSLRDNYLGKEYQQEQRKRNMKKYETRNSLLKLNSFAKIYLKKLDCTLGTADLSNLKKSQILVT